MTWILAWLLEVMCAISKLSLRRKSRKRNPDDGHLRSEVGGYASYEGRCEHAELAEIAHEAPALITIRARQSHG
jgi:hypothetical protein